MWVALNVLGWSGGVRFFCGDETRLGLKTLGGRKITVKGVKPLGTVQWQFKATYIYGIVEPKTGEHFFFEFSHLNTDCFQAFLNLISEQFKNDLLIIQVDNGGFHKAKRLKVPSNIILLFQPPHCQATFWDERFGGEGFFPKLSREDSPQKLAPELNPIEQVWQYLKRRLRWSLPATLDQLRQQLKERLEALTLEVVASITGRRSILNALSVANI